MEEGWIKIFRLFLEWEWYGDTNMVRVFLHLLLKANYEDKRWQGIVVKRGQLVTSSLALAEETHLSRQRVRTCLSRLEHTGEISIKSTNKYSIITICKYGNYQAVNLDNQPTNNQQITNNQPQHKNIRSKEVYNIDTNVSTSVQTDAGEIDFNSIKDFFNKTMEGRAIPKIRTGISDRRKAMLRARIQQYGIDTVYEVITKASVSSFLNGGGRKGFVANLEWLMRPNNFPKVLEGNYDDRPITPQINETNKNRPTYNDQRQAEREQLARGYAAVVARRLAEDDAREAELRQP